MLIKLKPETFATFPFLLPEIFKTMIRLASPCSLRTKDKLHKTVVVKIYLLGLLRPAIFGVSVEGYRFNRDRFSEMIFSLDQNKSLRAGMIFSVFS